MGMARNGVTYREMGRNGRLGNQLFQIAGTIAYALDHNKDFAFPPWEYSKWMLKSQPVGFLPNAINVPVQFHYAPIENIPNKDVNLVNGHMQTAKYFLHRWDTIKPYLTISDEHRNYLLKQYNKYLSQRCCSIHVRRTDYTTEINQDYHGVMPIEYYKEAIRVLYGSEDYVNVCFIICTDDVAWAKEAFSFLPNAIFPQEVDILDLFLMSYCDKHIIANSSFSWWSAFLGDRRREANCPPSTFAIQTTPSVVCPKKWFNNAPINSNDVACEGWIQI